MIMKKLLFSSPIKCVPITLLAMWLSVVPTKLVAQTASQSQKIADDSTGDDNAAKPNSAGSGDNATTPVAGKPVDINAEILKELEQMRARIQQLEAQLKAQQGPSAGPSASAPSDSQPAASEAYLSRRFTTPTASVQAQPAAAPPAEKPAPFSFADFTWMNGNTRTKDIPFDSKFFTPEIRFDVSYIYDYNHPQDDTIVGSAEVFRAFEFQLAQIGIGGDFHWDNVRGRIMTQVGMYSQTQPRNDASVGRGQWTLDGAYRYIAEAYGGYHYNKMYGINVDAGIFVSYIGLFSWYNFDNWTYQPSYVSSNTPFFFNGVRVQLFPSEKLKIEPWFINGWQSYGRFNNRPGLGFQIAYRPKGWLAMVFNGYGVGADTLGNPGRIRYHSDNSLQIKYYDHPDRELDKMAFSFTGDIGCEHGGGVSCAGNSAKGPKQSFLGYMVYNRMWFHKDLYALTLGGGQINNPGRYLVLLPPINGATAFSGTPYFTENPGDPFKAWDASATADYMPNQYITFRFEYDHRGSNVPYFAGHGGVTPPGGNTGPPGSFVTGFAPDLRKLENRLDMAVLVYF